MSLVNDALKRAAEAKKQHPSDSPPNVPLFPVDYAARPNPFLRMFAVLVVLALVAFSAWSFSKWWQTSRPSGQAAPTNVVVARTVAETENLAEPPASRSSIRVSTNVVVRTLPAAGSETEPSAVSSQAQVERNLIAAPAIETNSRGVASTAPPGFPQLKLQSIIYRANNPAVVINGEMLHVGDTIKDARVVKIERHIVTVVWQDETNLLSLPRL